MSTTSEKVHISGSVLDRMVRTGGLTAAINTSLDRYLSLLEASRGWVAGAFAEEEVSWVSSRIPVGSKARVEELRAELLSAAEGRLLEKLKDLSDVELLSLVDLAHRAL